MTTYISNSAHYQKVLSRVLQVKESLWIGTADVKDLYIEDGKTKKPFLEVLAKLIKKGVAVRLHNPPHTRSVSGGASRHL